MQRRNYAWSPFCKKQARECGGYDKKKCDVYGAHGSDRDSRPSDEQLTQAKKRLKAEQVAADRKRKREAASQ